jgi:hypothetical protein
MKLTNLTTTLKNNALKLLAVSALAGAALAATPAAQAQVRFGVVIGGPRYYAPAPPVVYGYPYGYYHHPYFDHYRWEREHFYHDRWHRW